MQTELQVRYRSGTICTTAGRFEFDGYDEATWQRPSRNDALFIVLKSGDEFPQIGHACWWIPSIQAKPETAAEQRMTSEGAPTPPIADGPA
ncbi:MAG: hypothetical protein ACKVS9_02275 [Phycisphaerae bacterium]